MKKMKRLFTAIIVLAVLAGCGKKVDVAFSSESLTIAPEGSTIEVTLTSNGDWTVDSYPEWLTVSPTSGKGDATLTLTAPANNNEETRSGEVCVTTKDNSATLTVTQEPLSTVQASIVLNPTEITAEAEGGTFEVVVTANCEWTINNTTNWIHCEPMSGQGNGTVTMRIDPIEGDMDSREANIIFGGADNTLVPLHVKQQAPLIVYISLNSTNLSFDYLGGSQNVTIYSNANWTASCEADWVTLSAISGGDGEANVTVTVPEYSIPLEARIAEVNFTTDDGTTALLTVKQEGAPDPHFLEVSPRMFVFDKEGGTAEIAISCDTDWIADLNCEWASVSAQTGNGNGTITLTVTPNPIATPRIIEFKVISGVLSQVLTVTQQAGDEPLEAHFDPDTLYPSYDGGFEHFNLLSNTSWQLETSSSWITLLTSSGNGDAMIDIVVDSNYGPDERTGYVNAKHNGQVLGTLVVNQEGKPNIFETNVTEINARPEGGEYTIQLTSNQSWSLNWDVDWITCTPDSGIASSDIIVIVQASNNPRPRTGHIKIVGSTGAQIIVTVNQNN